MPTALQEKRQTVIDLMDERKGVIAAAESEGRNLSYTDQTRLREIKVALDETRIAVHRRELAEKASRERVLAAIQTDVRA